MAGHPEVQARVAAELGAAGLLATARNPNPRRPTYGDLAALPYLDAVLRESLRIMPVSVFMYRETVAPVTDIAGFAVPANTEVMVRAAALYCAVPWSGSLLSIHWRLLVSVVQSACTPKLELKLVMLSCPSAAVCLEIW